MVKTCGFLSGRCIVKGLHKNATLRKGNRKKLFYAFHHYYMKLKNILNIQQLKYFNHNYHVFYLKMAKAVNKYRRSKKLRSITPCFKKFV